MVSLLFPVRRGDVLSAWSGIRPLVLNPAAKDTQSIARNHIIEISDSNLITIAGRCIPVINKMHQPVYRNVIYNHYIVMITDVVAVVMCNYKEFSHSI